MKPLSPDVHQSLAAWVKRGGVLVVCDDDTDPYNAVREWWNSDGRHCRTPREDLFAQLGLPAERASVPARTPVDSRWTQVARRSTSAMTDVGKGGVIWMRENPAGLAATAEGDARLVATVKQAAAHARLKWRETNYLLLRRGPYVLAAGLDESVAGEPKTLAWPVCEPVRSRAARAAGGDPRAGRAVLPGRSRRRAGPPAAGARLGLQGAADKARRSFAFNDGGRCGEYSGGGAAARADGPAVRHARRSAAGELSILLPKAGCSGFASPTKPEPRELAMEF